MSGTRFATVLSADLATHPGADHWVQTDKQATRKEGDGWYCVRHVLTHTATTSAAVALALVVTGQRCRPGALAARAVVNGVTHYFADRRKPLLKMAEWRGKKGWVDNDPNAAYQLDQSWHIFWLFAGAAIDAVVARQKAD